MQFFTKVENGQFKLWYGAHRLLETMFQKERTAKEFPLSKWVITVH